MTTPLTALKTTNRQWHELSPDVTRQIRNFRPIHPTALLIKDLEFRYFPEDRPPWLVPNRLQVTSACALFIRMLHKAWPYDIQWRGRFEREMRNDIVLDDCRQYTLEDFNYSDYDIYQISSDLASGIRLGREAGTERWGHETGINQLEDEA